MRATSCKSTSPGALLFALPCFKTGLFPEGERDNLTPLGGTSLLGRVSHSAASGCKTARFSRACFVSCEFVPSVAVTCCAAFCATFSILCATCALDSALSSVLLPKDLQAPPQGAKIGLRGRGLSKNLHGRCPVLVTDGNLRGEQDYVAKAGEAKTIIVSILLDIPLIKEGIFLQHHLTKGAVSHAHLEYSL